MRQRLAPVDAQLLQVPEHILPGRIHLDIRIDEQHFALFADVDGVAHGHWQSFENSIGPGGLPRGIAENRISQPKIARELPIDLGLVGAGRKDSHIELL